MKSKRSTPPTGSVPAFGGPSCDGPGPLRLGDRIGRLSDGFRNEDVYRDSVVEFGRMLDETYGTKLFDDASLWDFITDTVTIIREGCRRILEGTGREC